MPGANPPVKAEVPLRTVPEEARHAATETDPRHRTEGDDRKLPLFVGMIRTVLEQLRKTRRCPGIRGVIRLNCRLRVIRGDVAIEVEQLPLVRDDTLAHHRKFVGGDIWIVPVTTAVGNHLGKRLCVVDGEGCGSGKGRGQTEHGTECHKVWQRARFDALHQSGQIPIVQSAEIGRARTLLSDHGQCVSRLPKRRISGVAVHRNPLCCATPCG